MSRLVKAIYHSWCDLLRLLDQKPMLLNFAFLIFAIGLATYAMHARMPFPPVGPANDIVTSAVNLWNEGELKRDDFIVWDKYFKQLSLEQPNSLVWQDKFSLGKNGELRQTHALLMSVLAVPFYGLFGDSGFWIFNQLMLWVSLFSFYRLAEKIGGRQAATRSTMLLCCCSPILLWSYHFSYDVMLTALVFYGTLLAAQTPLIGAFLYCNSLFIRPSEILFLPIVWATWVFVRKDPYRYTLRFSVGALLAVFLFVSSNYLFWGDPFATAHSRRVDYVHGAQAFVSLKDVMPSWSVLKADWGQKIFSHPEAALLPIHMMVLIFPFAFWLGYRRGGLKKDGLFIGILFAGVARMIFAWSLPHWISPGYGPRYAMAGILFCSLSTAYLFLGNKPNVSKATLQID